MKRRSLTTRRRRKRSHMTSYRFLSNSLAKPNKTRGLTQVLSKQLFLVHPLVLTSNLKHKLYKKTLFSVQICVMLLQFSRNCWSKATTKPVKLFQKMKTEASRVCWETHKDCDLCYTQESWVCLCCDEECPLLFMYDYLLLIKTCSQICSVLNNSWKDSYCRRCNISNYN